MIPILYPKGDTTYSGNGLGRLPEAIVADVHEVRNGVFELEIEIPTDALHYSDIELGSIIRTKPSPNRTVQSFEVTSIEETSDGMMADIFCQHVSYRLNKTPVMPFTAASASLAMQGLKNNAAEPCPFTFSTDVTRAGSYSQTVPSSIRARLQGEKGSVVQIYQGELEFNNHTVYLWANRGSDRGTSIRYGKNLKTIEQDKNIQNTITGILPYWRGQEGQSEVVMWLPEKVLYSANASNFPYHLTACVDMSGDFDEKPTEAQLRAAGNAYITNNNIGVPEVGFDVDFVALAQTTEYENVALLERVELCDIVTVIFPEFNISTQAKVVETYFDSLRERYVKVRIGDQRISLSSTIAQQPQEIKESEDKQITFFTQALEQMTALLNGDLTGAGMITQTDVNGNPVGLIFMDTNDPATAINCLQINANGIGFSNQGVGGPFSSAWGINNTLDMSQINVIHLNASAIDTGTLSADYISGGTLVGVKISNGNGTFYVDANGNVTANSLSSNNATITGGSINISGTQNTNKIQLKYQRYGSTTNYEASMAPGRFKITGRPIAALGDVEIRVVPGGIYGFHNQDTTEKSSFSLSYNSSPGIRLLLNNADGSSGFSAEGGEIILYSETGNAFMDIWVNSSGQFREQIYDNAGNLAISLDPQNGLIFWSGGRATKTYPPT